MRKKANDFFYVKISMLERWRIGKENRKVGHTYEFLIFFPPYLSLLPLPFLSPVSPPSLCFSFAIWQKSVHCVRTRKISSHKRIGIYYAANFSLMKFFFDHEAWDLLSLWSIVRVLRFPWSIQKGISIHWRKNMISWYRTIDRKIVYGLIWSIMIDVDTHRLLIHIITDQESDCWQK